MTPVPNSIPPSHPLVHIVVLNYRMREQVRACLASLRQLRGVRRVIVVDNDSDDGCAEMVQEDFPAALFIQTGGNLGYTGGNNRGLQAALAAEADYVLILNPDTVVINPEDWEAIELTKASDGQYIMANPMALAGPQLWGKRVVATNSIAEGTFLVGAFTMGAQVWDRMDAAVQISYEDGDNFKKNMATLLAEERLALTVYRPSAFIKGTFA